MLAVLRRRGPAGTHRLEWSGPSVVDGGPPILHLAGRVDALKGRGHVIESRHRRRDRVVTYVLVADAAAASRRSAQAQLVDLGRVDVDVDLSDFELRTPTSTEPGACELCACARALPAPCPDGELRCARCRRPTNGWQW